MDGARNMVSECLILRHFTRVEKDFFLFHSLMPCSNFLKIAQYNWIYLSFPLPIMLTNTPKKTFTFKGILNTSLKAVFLFEAAAFAVSYGVWYKLNTDREFRLYMYKNHNWALEGFYTIGEKVSDIKTRELDLKVWTNEGKI